MAKEKNPLVPAEIQKVKGSSVQRAREVYAEKAALAVALFFKNIKRAMEAGDHETVSKALQWYMEHSPKTESGDRILETGVDVKQVKPVESGPTGPIIQLGFRLGGAPQPTLPPAQPDVIDIQPEPEAEYGHNQ